MSIDLLEEWKKECHSLSSFLSIKKVLERSDVDGVYEVFRNYFPLNFFTVVQSETAIETKPSWIHFLLMKPKHTGCQAAVFEIANLLLYLKTLSKSTQRKFTTLFKDTRQFRDMFFEIYLTRLLQYNNIAIEEKPKEGNKELDVACTINKTRYLCECRKVYAPGLSLLDLEVYLIEYFYIKSSMFNKFHGLIGTVKFANGGTLKMKRIFKERLDTFINGYQNEDFNTIDYHVCDTNGEFSVVDYNTANNIEVNMFYDQFKFHLMFKVIPPDVVVPGVPNISRIEMKARFNIPQTKIVLKLLSSIEEKRKQHQESTFTKKIYFIDSESIPDFDLPILRIEKFDEEEKIQEYIDKKFSDNEIVCFIIRDYIGPVPRVSIKVFGKNIDKEIKNKLENLKTDFDYRISYI